MERGTADFTDGPDSESMNQVIIANKNTGCSIGVKEKRGLVKTGAEVVQLIYTSTNNPPLPPPMPPEILRGPYFQSGSSTSIVVRWRTDVPCESIIQYGTASGALPTSASPGLPDCAWTEPS